MIAENLKKFREELGEKVTLVAVSKTKPSDDIKEAYDAGHRDFGENRIQEMTDKYEELPRDIRWHMIGHVQGNKIKYMAPYVHMVHGMDKPKRLKELNKEAAKNDRVIDCLIQVHIAEEDTKFGFSQDEVHELFQRNLEDDYPNIRVRGLMGMATLTEDEAQIEKEFKSLESLYQKIREEHKIPYFDILSTGMSGDYKIALRCGSNMVRIGSAIFGPRK